MISLTSLLLSVLVIGVFIVLLAGIGAVIYYSYAHRRKEVELADRFSATVSELTGSVTALASVTESLQFLPKFVEGHAKAAGHMALQIQAFRKSVEAFSKIIVRNEPESSPALQAYNEEEADKAFSLDQLLKDHPEFDPEQARQLMESALSPGIE